MRVPWRIFWVCIVGLVLVVLGLVLNAFWPRPQADAKIPASVVLPRPSHVVIVMEENHSYPAIIGSDDVPYINTLARQSALFTNAHGVTHPSQPNYLALFSGSTYGLTTDNCPNTFSGPNLATELTQAGLSFKGYSENLSGVGFKGCFAPSASNPLYARKHTPWANFSAVPPDDSQPWTNFPTNYDSLPTVSIVVPNQLHDMHSGTIEQADTWLQQNMNGYVQWATTHNSLLIITWDEQDGLFSNKIPTLFVGPMIRPGHYGESINHYNVLRTLEDMYKLPYANQSANVSPITNVWQSLHEERQ